MPVDIKILGRRDLERQMKKLVDKTQKKIVRQAIRAAAKRAKDRIVRNIRNEDLVLHHFMLAGFYNAKIKSSSRKPRELIRMGPEWPTRDQLGIAADDKYYYPMAVEMGHNNVPAHPFVRPAMDEHRASELREMSGDIAKGILRESKG